MSATQRRYRCIRTLVYSGLSDDAEVEASNSNNFEAAVASLAQLSKLRLDKKPTGGDGHFLLNFGLNGVFRLKCPSVFLKCPSPNVCERR